MAYNYRNNQLSTNSKSKLDTIISHTSHRSLPSKNSHQNKQQSRIPLPNINNDQTKSLKEYINRLQTDIKCTINQINKEKIRTKELLYNIGKVYQVGDLNRNRIDQWMENFEVKQELSKGANLSSNNFLKQELEKIINECQRQNKKTVQNGSNKTNTNGNMKIHEQDYNQVKKKRKVNQNITMTMETSQKNQANSISNETIINLIGKSGREINGLTAMEIKEYIHPQVLKDINKK